MESESIRYERANVWLVNEPQCNVECAHEYKWPLRCDMLEWDDFSNELATACHLDPVLN